MPKAWQYIFWISLRYPIPGIVKRWCNEGSKDDSAATSAAPEKSYNLVFEAVQNKVIDKVDEEAVMDEEDSKDAYAELAQDNIGMGYGTINLVLLNENEKVLADELADIKAIINDLGFVATIEKDNASQAWLSTIPACYSFGVRTYFINSTNFILWSPVSSLWEGQKENEHFKKLNISSTPLMKCETPEKLPFYLNLHVADVGHTMVAGATGTGKSVLLNTIASNLENMKILKYSYLINRHQAAL